MKNKKTRIEVMSFIPLREGSKRIKSKNLRKFAGKPLLFYPIKDSLTCKIITRTVVCTESEKIASLAKNYGADVPFLRPKKLANDYSDVKYSLLYTLRELKRKEGYEPKYVVILQATSPLRLVKDIYECFDLLLKSHATSVLTVTKTHPKLYRLSKQRDLVLVNGTENKTSITQLWPSGYILNGCSVYIVSQKAFLKEKLIITKKTKAVVLPKWRSVDLDEWEDWVLAETIYKNRNNIERRMKSG